MHAAPIGFKLATLAVVYLVSFAVSYGLLLPAPLSAAPPTNEPIPPLVALIAVAVLNTVAVSWLILRSRWNSWRLTLCLIVAFYGIQTVLSQVESIVFPAVSRRMPEGTVVGLLLAGFVHAAIFIPIAVGLLGRSKRSPSEASSSRESAPMREAGLRIAFAVAHTLSCISPLGTTSRGGPMP